MSEAANAPDPSRVPKRWIAISTALIVILLFVTLVIVKPAMPDRITLLAGPEGGADHTLALRYAEDLRLRGLDADVVVTQGEFDSLRRLPEVVDAVAFLPSAMLTEDQTGVDMQHLVALGSIGFSPIWLFGRAGLDFQRIEDLAGRTVATPGAETACDHVARRLIEVNGLTGEVELRPIAGLTAREVIEGFRLGTLDAAFVAGIPDSGLVRGLLHDEASRFVKFDRVEAYAARIPGVIPLSAPEGVFDFERNVPEQDAQLLATTTSLVARKDLHRAVAPMLLVTAESVRDETTSFSTTVRFPSREHVTLPLDRGARRYFDQGQTGLSKFLPYKIARLAQHVGFVVAPLLLIVGLLLKIVPTALRVWIELKLRRWFKGLAAVEQGFAAGNDRTRLRTDLDRIDRASGKMFVPGSAVRDYLELRQALHDLRDRVGAGGEESG